MCFFNLNIDYTLFFLKKNQPKMITYINNTDLNEMIDMTIKTSGNKGSCLEYIQNIYMKCKELGIQDEHVQKMWELINSPSLTRIFLQI